MTKKMKVKAIICAAVAVTSAAAVWAARGGPCPPMAHECRLVFSGYEGKETLKDFAALVKIPDGLTGFDYRDSAADGSDVCFFGADGKPLAHEIDTWNPDGDSYVWVRVPELTKATTITARWGKSGGRETASVQQQGVWNDDYMGVWHFSKFKKGVTRDSKYGLDAVLHGKDMRKFIHAEGPVGKCYFSASQTTTSGPYLQVAKDDRWTAYGKTGKLTVSFLLNSAIPEKDVGDRYARVISSKPFKGHPKGIDVVVRGGEDVYACGQGKTNFMFCTKGNVGSDLYSFHEGWAYVTVVYDGAAQEACIYYNGRLGSTKRGAVFAPTVSDWPLAIGHYGEAVRLEPQGHECFFCGYIDEVRLSKAALSPDRIRADYLTLTRPTQFAVAEGGKAQRILTRRLADGDTPPEIPAYGTWRGANIISMLLPPWNVSDPIAPGRYIEEVELELLEKCGLNFARLPIDYRFFLSADDWEHWLEDGLEKVDNAIEYGRKHKVHIMLCLYRAPGYRYYYQDVVITLKNNPKAQEAFKRIWREFARRYRGIPNSELTFNLVNESVGFNEKEFIKVFGETVEEIHKVDPGRFVWLDGKNTGKVPVKHFFNVPLTGQCFRGYQPHQFTHYGFRGKATGPVPHWPKGPDDKDMLWVQEKQAWEFSLQDCVPKDYPVMIGEFGCVACGVTHESALKFMASNMEKWRSRGYGWAIWDYDGPFGFVESGRPDAEYIEVMGRKVDQKMLELLRQK